jgi:hypothetical protein
VVDNPARAIPNGLNAAVAALSDARFIIRVDGHGRLSPEYLRTIHHALGSGIGDVVGPSVRQVPGAATILARAIADALSSPLGTGGTPSRRRLVGPRRCVHTVMSCWRRSWWERLGGYDEALASNEDFDFDWRAGRLGARVVSLPMPTYELVARATLGALWRQRWRYGWWKAKVICKHPRSLQPRQIAPPLALILAPAPGLWWPAGLVLLGAYLMLCWCCQAWQLHRRRSRWRDWAAMPVLAPVIFGVIHGSWSLALLLSLVTHPLRRLARRR